MLSVQVAGDHGVAGGDAEGRPGAAVDEHQARLERVHDGGVARHKPFEHLGAQRNFGRHFEPGASWGSMGIAWVHVP